MILTILIHTNYPGNNKYCHHHNNNNNNSWFSFLDRNLWIFCCVVWAPHRRQIGFPDYELPEQLSELPLSEILIIQTEEIKQHKPSTLIYGSESKLNLFFFCDLGETFEPGLIPVHNSGVFSVLLEGCVCVFWKGNLSKEKYREVFYKAGQ